MAESLKGFVANDIDLDYSRIIYDSFQYNAILRMGDYNIMKLGLEILSLVVQGSNPSPVPSFIAR